MNTLGLFHDRCCKLLKAVHPDLKTLHSFVQPNKSKPGLLDPNRISIHQPAELVYWSARWEISRGRLLKTIKKVGPMVKDLKKALAKYKA